MAELEETIASLRNELSVKNDRLVSLQEQLQQAKSECDLLRQENKKLKTQRASLVATGGISFGKSSSSEEEVEDDEEDLSSKISFFLHKTFGLRQPRTVFAREDVYILALNSLVSLHHLDHTKDMEDSELSLTPTAEEQANQPDTVFFWKAAKIAFAHALLFLKQLSEECNEEDHRLSLQRNFPLQWLLGVFPATFPPSPTDFSSLSWLPLHVFLAANPASTTDEEAVDQYIDKLGLLLDVFGESALTEDVKPLSILVAKRIPCLPAVQFYVQQVPESLWLEDEDGSIPLMHACANNATLDTIDWLLAQYQNETEDNDYNTYNRNQQKRKMSLSDIKSKALYHVDRFGCAAIHYAAFNGRTETVQFLIEQDHQLSMLPESNGALALHDAVQNQHGHGEQYRLCEWLLSVAPETVRQRDERGALPLHLAARHSSLTVVDLLLKAFPYAIYAPDEEGLLPLHYYAARSQQEKSLHLDLQALLYEKNPKSTSYSDDQLMQMEKQDIKVAAAAASGVKGQGGTGITSFVSSWFKPKENVFINNAVNNTTKNANKPQMNNSKAPETGERKMRRSSTVKLSAHGR